MNEFVDLIYPESDPFDEGYLKTEDGHHELFYQQFGNPDGQPVVFLHGGPGGGCSPTDHRFFDPDYYRIVIYDQRGATHSKPFASITANNPETLTHDNDHLRTHLGIDKWHVFGGSWGATLALLYAQAYPDRVKSMTLRGVFLMTAAEVDHFINGMGKIYSEVREKFVNFLPENERTNILENYYKRILDADPGIHMPAARAFVNYELGSAFSPPMSEEKMAAALQDPRVLGFARMEIVFMRDHLSTNKILDNVGTIRHIPTRIVHGRQDAVCLPYAAYDLYREMDYCRLDFIESAGHASSQPAIARQLVNAMNCVRDHGVPFDPAIFEGIQPKRRLFSI